MQVFIAGVDGYLGWALAQYLVSRGHEVAGCDNYFRRNWVAMAGRSRKSISIQEDIRRMT